MMLIKSKMAKRVAEKKGRFPFSLFILGKGKAIEIKLADPMIWICAMIFHDLYKKEKTYEYE